MSRSTKRSSGSDSTSMQRQKNTVSPKRWTTPSKSPQRTNPDYKHSPNSLAQARESKTPSPTFMFVPMSSEPGSRAKIQPGLRASAKAHVMHDYQRKTAEKRLADWKMSTPKTYSPAPKEPSLVASVQQSTLLPQEVVGWETVVFRAEESQSDQETKPSPPEPALSRRSALPSRQISSSSSSQNSLTRPLNQHSASIIPSQPRGSNQLDVFQALPLQVSAWDETVINRWLNYDRIPWCPVNGQSQWIPFVTNSPVLLHTNLYTWGMHWHGKLEGVDQHNFLNQNPQILEHKIAAIQMINTSLEADAKRGYSDEVLAAVAIFINISLQFLNREEAASHMAGLEMLLKLRGGLGRLSELGTVGVLLQRMISWNDLFYVELFGGDLRFSVLPRWDEAWQAVYAPLVDDPVTHLEPLQARFAGDSAQEIATLLQEIQLVCDDIQARPLETLNTAEKTLRHDNLFRFERRLCLATRITTMRHHTYDASQESNSAMWRAVAYAALMFVHHHMRPGYPLHWAQFRALVVQLRGEISTVRIESWDAVPALHLWVLAVGSWVSQREDWILRSLANACRVRACVSWESFEKILDLCPNMGRADEERFKTIWGDVAQLL